MSVSPVVEDGSLVPVGRGAVAPTPVDATRAETSCSIHSCWSAVNEVEGPGSSDIACIWSQ